MPEISINHHIYLAPHDQPIDVVSLPSLLAGANILAPEGLNWTDRNLQDWRKVSRGYLNPSDVAREGFINHILGHIHKTRKTIVFFDVPFGNPLVTEIIDTLGVQKRSHSVLRESSSHSWEDKKDIYDKYRRIWAKSQSRREDYMIDQSPVLLAEAIRTNPSLQRLDALEVLWTLGAVHRRVPKKLQVLGHNVKVSSDPNPFPFSYSYQAEAADPDQDLEDEFLAKAMLDNLFVYLFIERYRDMGLPFWKMQSDALLIIDNIQADKIPSILNRGTYTYQNQFEYALENLFKELAQGTDVILPDKKS